MKIIALSDLHGYLPTLDHADVITISGDIFPLEIQHQEDECLNWFKNVFANWVISADADRIIFIAGNHDFWFQSEGSASIRRHCLEISSKLIYLCDDTYEYGGIKFYGTPWVPNLKAWAFYSETEKELLSIPNCDILLTHTPPYHVCDVGVSLDAIGMYGPRDFGSKTLRKVLQDKRIKYCFCGHVHSGNHNPVQFAGTTVVNTSLKNEAYRPIYKPFVLYWM